MKTNKITKSIIVLLTVLILGSLSVSAYAKTNSDNAAETPAFKHGERKHHQNEHKKDRFEDWFEHRIESREITVDFSQLPDNPTDEEMFEFFKNNFMGSRSGENGKHSGGHKDSSLPADQPVIEPAPGSEPAPESVEPAPSEQPAEENVKDKA